jgi:pyruvate dehydrogenase E1 component beta subunit
MCAMDELVNQIAKIRYMFGGQARPAVVVRMPHGMWRNSAAQHSQTLESWFTHIPGVVVAVPATPADTAGLLVSAIRSDDPVLFFDPKNLFPRTGEVAAEIAPIPFGQARRMHAGDALTIVTWSAMVPAVAEAMETLAARGIAADVLDLRTLWPWDEAAVLASAARTGRLLVAHEAVTVAGFGAEIVARVTERLGSAAPRVARLGQPRVPVPFAPPLEDALKPDAAKVVAAAERLLAA